MKLTRRIVLAAAAAAMMAGASGAAMADIKFGVAAEPYPPFSSKDASGKWVGWEIDASIDWRILSDVNLQFLYGAFFPNEEIFPDNQDDLRQFVYGGVTYAF